MQVFQDKKLPPALRSLLKGTSVVIQAPIPTCLDVVHVLFITSIPVTQRFAGHAPHCIGLLSGVTGGDVGLLQETCLNGTAI